MVEGGEVPMVGFLIVMDADLSLGEMVGVCVGGTQRTNRGNRHVGELKKHFL